jgi:hypothetical protein
MRFLCSLSRNCALMVNWFSLSLLASLDLFAAMLFFTLRFQYLSSFRSLGMGFRGFLREEALPPLPPLPPASAISLASSGRYSCFICREESSWDDGDEDEEEVDAVDEKELREV